MGSNVNKIQGFASRGELTAFDPSEIVIVGLDVPLTAENWWAYCPRVDEPIEEEFLADVRANGVR